MIDNPQFLIRLLQEIAYRLQEFLLSDLRSSPLLFLLLGTGYVLNSMRYKTKYVSILFFRKYSYIGLNVARKLVIVAAVYLLLFFLYTPTIANIVISIPAAFYSLYNLRTSSDWHLVYFLLPVFLIFVLFPNTTVQYLCMSSSIIVKTDQGERIALIAAFFAFIGWRETSMKGNYSREDTFRNRSDEIRLNYKENNTHRHYPDQIEYRADVISVRVSESQNRIYRLFRYFFLTKFHGETRITLSFEQEINPNLLSVIDSPSLWHLPIKQLYEIGPGEYRIITESTDMNWVEGEIHEIFELICFYSHSRKSLEVGKYTYPDVFYCYPIGIVGGFLCRKELHLMKPFSSRQKTNIRVDRRRELGKNSGIGSITPLTYSFANNDSRFYRTFQHLIFINLPWSLVKKWVRKKYSRLDEREPLTKHDLGIEGRPLYEGLYLLIDAYRDHDIISTHQGISSDDIDCTFLQIHSNRQGETWLNIDIPICGFHPEKFADLKIMQGGQLFCDVEEELDAKYVVRNCEHFYTIYDLKQDNWIIAKWLEFNEEPGELGAPKKAEFSRTISLVGTRLDGVIWERKD